MIPDARIAAIRFGFGPRLGEAPPATPEAWLGQLAAPPPEEPHALPIAEGYRLMLEDQRNPVGPNEAPRLRAPLRAESEGWAALCLTTPAPFRERLVAFFANHLTVSRRSGPNTTVAIPDRMRLIRAHLGGTYAELLLATTRHPSMLYYLDNAASIGPGSPAARRGGRGLNENLAREVLELHSVTPAAGYTQADVTEFAKLLTGWSVDRQQGGFAFRRAAHEPGAKTVMGQRFEEGEEGGIAALRWLGDHPATHRHLAFRLVQHFISDTPDPGAVAVVEAALRDTGGAIPAAARALLELPGAFTAPPAKIRPPHDFVLAAFRACGAEAPLAPAVLGAMGQLSQELWNAPSPEGWPDGWADWATPEALLRRVEWAYAMAGRFGRLDARAAAEHALGPLARAETVEAIGRAGAVRDAVALLIGSPEFQRR